MIDYTLPLDQLPDPLPIEPLTKPFDVTIMPPGSKSITCRAYVLAALATGESRLVRPLRANDTDQLLDALCTLGAEARWEGEDVVITGVSGRFPRGGSVNLGDGGTPTRFMIACACLAAEPVVVDGSQRMRERPVAEGVDMLRQLGAHIEYVEEEGRLPVRVVPSDSFNGGELKIGRCASSQFISAMMLTAFALPNGVDLRPSTITSASYVHLTLRVMRDFRLRIHQNLLSRFSKQRIRRIRIRQQKLRGLPYEVEADASSAAYWALAATIIPKSRLVVEPLPPWSWQPDVATCRAFHRLGCIETPSENECDGLFFGGPNAVRGSNMTMDCTSIPDGSLALSIAATFCSGATTLSGLETLRVKETDRIAALATELRKIGCTVETTEDSIAITPADRSESGPTGDHGRDARATGDGERGSERHGTGDSDSSESCPTGEPIVIETYNDHRMAMAFAVLGLARPRLAIRNPACVAKSYPGFWRDFAKLYGEGTAEERHY